MSVQCLGGGEEQGRGGRWFIWHIPYILYVQTVVCVCGPKPLRVVWGFLPCYLDSSYFKLWYRIQSIEKKKRKKKESQAQATPAEPKSAF